MGIFVLCFGASAMFAVFFIMFWSKKWVKTVSAILLMVCFGTGIYWIANDPLAVYLDTEMTDTYKLVEVKTGDEICSTSAQTHLYYNDIKIQITYRLDEQFDDTTYMFVDEANENIYYVRENRVFITKNKGDITQIRPEEVSAYQVEIIKGNYENAYFEKYETKTKMSFLSVGSGRKVEYKFYIPEKN